MHELWVHACLAGIAISRWAIMAEKPAQQPEEPPGDGNLGEKHSSTPPYLQPKPKSPTIKKAPPPLQPQSRPPPHTDGSFGKGHPDTPPIPQPPKHPSKYELPLSLPQEIETKFMDEPPKGVVPVYNGNAYSLFSMCTCISCVAINSGY